VGTRKAIGYFRISGTAGALMRAELESQREALQRHASANDLRVVEECVDYENGKRAGRPQFNRALAACKSQDAVLVVPSAGPLARDPNFFIELHLSGADFAVLDMPLLNRATLLAHGQTAFRNDTRRNAARSN
jgi:DNA invertase Pin-like site-specific DNA recombinase